MPEFFCEECKQLISERRVMNVLSRRGDADSDTAVRTCSAACQAKKNLREYRAKQREKKLAQKGN